MKKNICLFIIFFIPILGFSQIPLSEIENTPTRHLRALANNSLQNGDVYSAIEFLEEYCSREEDAGMMFLLAESYRKARIYPLAKKWYNAAYHADPSEQVLALYYYATMLMVEKEYDRAQAKFTQFRRELRNSNVNSDKDYNRLARIKIQACESAFYIIDSILDVQVTRLPESINKASIEFAPRYLNDSLLLYSSLRSDTAVYRVPEKEKHTVPK